MAGKGPGIYFNRKTKEVVSINGGQEDFDLNGWARVSDDPTLRLLVVRELLLEKGLIRNDRAVYWSGFRTPGRADDDGSAVDLTFLKQGRQESDLRSARRRRGSGSAVQRLLRSILG